MQISLVYSTFPSRDAASGIIHKLLEKRLIACANILGPVTSLYTWEGKVEETQEFSVFFKTTAQNIEALFEALQTLHPYETPAILEIPIEKCSSSFEAWIAEAITPYPTRDISHKG